MMSVFIESVKRLYDEGKIKEDKILQWYEEGKITVEEKLFILEVH